jgi:hypothetical protein
VSALTMQKTFMTIAKAEAAGAMISPIFPQAKMISFQFKLCDGVAANLDMAGQKWREVAGNLQKTAAELQDAVASIPADTWTADDRTAYEQKVREVCEQLEIVATFFMAVGIALTAFAYALLTYAVFAVAMATVVVGLAIAADAAVSSVVGAPALGPIEAAASTCLTITWGATAVLGAAAQMAAMVFQGGAALTALLEYQHGNKQALSDFKHAEALGAETAVANLAQNAANAGLAYMNRDVLPGGKSKLPISNIDLDADVDRDEDLHVGGGATVNAGKNEITAGGHVIVDHDGGIEGGDVDAKVKRGNHEVGVRGGYDEGTITGGASYGYSNPYQPTLNDKAGVNPDAGTGGGGLKGDLGGSYNTHTGEYEVKGSGSASYAGGDVEKDELAFKHDKEGKNSLSEKTTSWYGDSQRTF